MKGIKMRDGQKALMKDYLKEIDEPEDNEARGVALFRIIKAEKRTPMEVINGILTTGLIILLVLAIIQGRYILNEVKVVETCQGRPVDDNITLILDETGRPVDIFDNRSGEVPPWERQAS